VFAGSERRCANADFTLPALSLASRSGRLVGESDRLEAYTPLRRAKTSPQTADACSRPPAQTPLMLTRMGGRRTGVISDAACGCLESGFPESIRGSGLLLNKEEFQTGYLPPHLSSPLTLTLTTDTDN